MVTDVPLTSIGGDGVFVTEIEHALHERRIDLAVHSLKDLPTAQPGGLCIVVADPREDVRDVLVTQTAILPPSPRIGTCSLRRTAQIRALYPSAQVLPLRGNVDTRLRKLGAGDYDGIVLAAAGLHRLMQYPETDQKNEKKPGRLPPLTTPSDAPHSARMNPKRSSGFAPGLQERLTGRLSYLPIDSMMPAPGQGALALEIRDELELLELVAPLSDPITQATTTAERTFMRHLGAGCYLPIAAYGTIAAETLTLQGLVISLDGQRQVRVKQSIPWTGESTSEHARRLGIDLAEQALEQGASAIISSLETNRGQEQQHA